MGGDLTERCYAGLIYDELEEYENSIRLLTDHLATNPSNAAAYNNRAVALWEIGEVDRAIEDFSKAIQFAEGDALPAQNRGRLLQQMGNLKCALADFDLAVRLSADDPYLRRTRGHARWQAGDLTGAANDFRRAIALEPDFAEQYLNRAAIYERLGEPMLAQQDREAAFRLSTSA